MAPAETKPDSLPEIPDKLYFQIGEVSRLVGLEAYVLRYWEKEFPALAPKKLANGRRFYRRKDVELLLEIKQLLYEKRFTIEGARMYLQTQSKQTRRDHVAAQPRNEQASLFASPPSALREIRDELASILAILK